VSQFSTSIPISPHQIVSFTRQGPLLEVRLWTFSDQEGIAPTEHRGWYNLETDECDEPEIFLKALESALEVLDRFSQLAGAAAAVNQLVDTLEAPGALAGLTAEQRTILASLGKWSEDQLAAIRRFRTMRGEN
jgi:hypothetical protein